ncbi:MAG: anti-sigma factor [Thermoanaerobaculia bacterium]
MPTCKEVSTAIASEEIESFGWRRRLVVWMHLLMCRHCRRYAAQMRAIGAAARDLVLGRGEDPDMLQELERRILERVDEAEAEN